MDPALSLRSDIMVTRYLDLVALRRGDTSIRFGVFPQKVNRQETTNLCTLAGPDWRELEMELAELDWLAPPQPPLPELAISLFSALRSLAANEADLAGKVVLIANEALALPTSSQLEDWRQAMRFFLSRMDWYRLNCYSGLIQDVQIDLQIWGDLPSEAHVNRIVDLAVSDKESLPKVYQLVNGEWSSTSQGAPGEVPLSELSDRRQGDRLSIVEVVPDNVVSILNHERLQLWMATGQFALPNLRFGHPPIDQKGVPRWCIGTDEDIRKARLKAVGEGVERFCMGDFQVGELTRAAANSLQEPWLDPRSLAAYSDSQKERLGLDEFVEGTPEWWVQGEGPMGSVLLPAALVFCPFSGKER